MTKAASPPLSVADFLNQQIEFCGRTQIQISEICGFQRPQMVSMMKTGRTRVPLDKMRVLARAVGADPLEFSKLVLGEYNPDLLWLLEELVRVRS
jgi:hypothetical protein